MLWVGLLSHHELISNNHSEFCVWYVHIILLLDCALICTHFGRFLNEFDFWSFCVGYNSFERVNLRYCCVYQSGEESWREEKSLSQFVYGWQFFWSSCGGVCDDIKFYMEMETELIYIHLVEWGDWFGWRSNCCVSSVSPYLRSLQFAIPRNCVGLTYHSVPWWTARCLWYNRLVLLYCAN